MKASELIMESTTDSPGMTPRLDLLFAKTILETLDANDFMELLEDIKQLDHHRATTVGLYATDQDPKELLYKFWQRTSDACPLVIEEAEPQEEAFREWVMSLFFQIT